MTTGPVLYEVEGHVATVTMNRPEVATRTTTCGSSCSPGPGSTGAAGTT
jgi:hypothetical protein